MPLSRPELVRNVLQTLFCSGVREFKEIFGEDGLYMWDKFSNHYNKRCDDFVCYLDTTNLEKLVAYCEAKHEIFLTERSNKKEIPL